MGSLLERARADARKILGGEWSTVLTFEAPTGEVVVINGTFFKRTLQVLTSEGNATNSKQIHCTFAERDLFEEYYPIRNAVGLVDLRDHKVSCADSTGEIYTYIVIEAHPDETLGIIRCPLGEYTP